MNIKEIKEMINLMNDNGLTELEIEREGGKIRIKKTPKGQTVINTASPQTEYAVEQTPESKEAAPKQAQAAKKTIEIMSPMVGTFYRSAAPEAQPFIETNQSIEVGSVICIIEAMKLMNEIKSEVKGKIKEILVENGDPVEFGQPLFLVEVA